MATSITLSSVAEPPFEKPTTSRTSLSLDEFLFLLPQALHRVNQNSDREDYVSTFQGMTLDRNDPVMRLFQRLDVSRDRDWWRRYALFDSSRHYTRNLIATDYTNYTLMLLCWNPGRESPIHNHPCDGCWLKVLQGSIKETRYVESDDDVSGDGSSRLRCTSNDVHQEGEITFIEDSMGYHKVGNSSSTEPAVTLHLYCPPFDRCKIWVGADARPLSSCVMTYHSAFGMKIGSDESMLI